MSDTVSAMSGWSKMSEELKKLTYLSAQEGFVLEIDESEEVHKEALCFFTITKGSAHKAESPFVWRIRKSTKANEWSWLFAMHDELVSHLRSRSYDALSVAV